MKQQYRFVKHHALGSRAPIRALANILAWQIKARLRRGVLRCAWVDGSVLMARRGMTGATGNLYVGLHEFVDMGFALHFLRPGDLFVDVRANIGSYTVLASRVCGAHSIAFEPDPGTAACLADNIRANHVASLVTVQERAVGADVGRISFSMHQDTVNHVVAADTPADQVRSVEVTTLDAVLAGRQPALIKIDVEGHEPEVIRGAETTLANPSLKAVILEAFDDPSLAMLSSHGFRRFAYDPFERTLKADQAHIWGGNTLFLRDEAFVAERVRAAPVRVIPGQRV